MKHLKLRKGGGKKGTGKKGKDEEPEVAKGGGKKGKGEKGKGEWCWKLSPFYIYTYI